MEDNFLRYAEFAHLIKPAMTGGELHKVILDQAGLDFMKYCILICDGLDNEGNPITPNDNPRLSTLEELRKYGVRIVTVEYAKRIKEFWIHKRDDKL